MGKPFSAVLRLSDELKVEFDFGQGSGEGEEAPDFSAQTALGACPKCGARVFEHGMAYTCEKAVGPGKSCDFRSGRMILQQPIERTQMEKLLATGRTDLLTGFMSKKNRKFKAFLVKTPQGKVGFEFLPRAEKPGKPPAPKEAVVEKPLKKAAAEKPAPKTASRKKTPVKRKKKS
jgi:DNA topoisomerase-3